MRSTLCEENLERVLNFENILFIFDSLQVNGIRKCSIDAQILALNNLQILNMSNNHIEHLPKRLGDLPLTQLDLSNNRLAKSNLGDWDWLDKQRIKSSLHSLNLSSNEVSCSQC